MVSNLTKLMIILFTGLLLGFLGFGIILTVTHQKQQILSNLRLLPGLVLIPFKTFFT